MAQSLTAEQMSIEVLTTAYPGLQMKTGDFNVTMAGSTDTDYLSIDTGVSKFTNNLLFWQIFPYAPQNSWGFYMRGSSMAQGATNLSTQVHLVNSSVNTNTVQIHWVAWGN